MSLEIRTSGGIFDCGAEAVVNPINCLGAMSRGLALEFKLRYPRMNNVYITLCAAKVIRPGKVWLWQAADYMVINFPTKDDWRNPSKLEWIKSGLEDLARLADQNRWKTIACPALGCGLGGLDFAAVQLLCEEQFAVFPGAPHVILFAPR